MSSILSRLNHDYLGGGVAQSTHAYRPMGCSTRAVQISTKVGSVKCQQEYAQPFGSSTKIASSSYRLPLLSRLIHAVLQFGSVEFHSNSHVCITSGVLTSRL